MDNQLVVLLSLYHLLQLQNNMLSLYNYVAIIFRFEIVNRVAHNQYRTAEA